QKHPQDKRDPRRRMIVVGFFLFLTAVAYSAMIIYMSADDFYPFYSPFFNVKGMRNDAVYLEKYNGTVSEVSVRRNSIADLSLEGMVIPVVRRIIYLLRVMHQIFEKLWLLACKDGHTGKMVRLSTKIK